MSEAESKPYYKIGEVCEITGTQPYVLRFWESEFPTLAPEKNRSGQRIYRQRDIELIRRIKLLLYEKEYTIAGARKVLESDEEEGVAPAGSGGAHEAGARDQGAARKARKAAGGADGGSAPPRGRKEEAAPGLPFRARAAADQTLEAEVRNLRAKLARAEQELRSILSDMERRNQG